jgi:uncharacterized protein YkwD
VNIQPSPVDLVAGALLVWWAYRGFCRGLVLTAFGTVLRALTLAAVMLWRGPVADYFTRRWAIQTDVATIAAIGLLILLFELVRRLGEGGLRGGTEVLLRDLPTWRYVDRLAGLATGFARGAVTLALVFVAILLLPLGPIVQTSIRQSYTGQAISLLWPAAVGATAEAFSGDETVGLGWSASGVSSSSGVAASPALGAPPDSVTPSSEDERQFLAMTNLARSQAGANALEVDPGLTDAARQHSLDMAKRAYFAHESPTGTYPSDRIRAAAVPFYRIAENIVFAPTVEDAFQSIMASPEHRANQLSSDYSRVGIGVIQTSAGVVITEDFAN